MTDPIPAAPPTRAEVTAAETRNDERLRKLQTEYGVQFDPASIVLVRLDHMVDVLFGDKTGDPPSRRAFDMSLAERIAEEIGKASVEVRRQVLNSAASGLIVPQNVAGRRHR